MSAGEYCNREVIIVDKTEPVREAINLMRTHHVGDVVIVERQDEIPRPIGILTDRDIVIEILAEDVNLDEVSIGDVMSYDLITITEDTKILDSIKLMHAKGVRRIPVVDKQGALAGILTVDDILELFVEQLTDLVGIISTQQHREAKSRK